MYVTFEEKEQIAFKCYPLDEKEPLKQLTKIIKEVGFSKLLGLLDIGPQIVYPFGFDIIVSANCIEFAMEQCTPIHKSPVYWKKQLEWQLKQRLKLLHTAKIVHGNIHPQNMVYHEKRKQIYLTDFRFSNYYPYSVGEKSEVQKAVNLNYCSDEIVMIFDGQQQESDLLMNDMTALDQSISQIRKENLRAAEKRLAKEYWDIDLGELFGG